MSLAAVLVMHGKYIYRHSFLSRIQTKAGNSVISMKLRVKSVGKEF